MQAGVNVLFKEFLSLLKMYCKTNAIKCIGSYIMIDVDVVVVVGDKINHSYNCYQKLISYTVIM